jgi:hypothetical protein
MITVQPIDQTTFRVTVEGRTTTTHTVTVSPSYYEKLTGKRVAPEVLVEKSFEFLLERESNTSILGSFELPVIGRYFPEYEKTIETMLAG